MTAYLWHQAQAQVVNPLPPVVPPAVPPPSPANGVGYVYFVLPAAVPNPLAGGAGVAPAFPPPPVGAPGGGQFGPNFGVSKILNVH
jgi:hypothetical protein